MKAYIKDNGYSNIIGIYLVSEGVHRTNITVQSWDPKVGPILHEEILPEHAVVDVKPFIQVTRPMFDALKEAFTDVETIKVSDEMVRSYRKEQERVDKMLTYLMEGR